MSPMNIHCKYDSLVPVGELQPHPKNRNKHPQDQIERLAKILMYQGVRAPIVVSRRSGKIVKGHGTLQAIKKNGWQEAPIVIQDFEDDDQEWLFVQSDNAIAMWAELDLKGINADLSELGPFDIDLIGIKDFEVEPLDKLLGDEDAVPDVKPTDIKLGDLFVLGNHRLLCGDSTDAAQVERLMNGEKADMVFTDPPYGVAYGSKNEFLNNLDKGNRIQKNIENDQGLTKQELTELIQKSMKCAEQFCHNKASYYLTAPPGEPLLPILIGIANADWQIKSCLVWVKNNHVLGRSDYNYKHEMIIYGWKKNGTHEFVGGFCTSVWEFPKPQVNDLHPTMKPIELIEFAIKNSSKKENKIIDLYGGSGSTLIACEKTNRKCFMMELDPQYCQVIIDRWEQYTGKKAVKHGSPT